MHIQVQQLYFLYNLHARVKIFVFQECYKLFFHDILNEIFLRVIVENLCGWVLSNNFFKS